MATTGLVSFAVTMANLGLPDVGRAFPGASDGALSWVLNSYSIVFAALLVIAGSVGDAIGHRRALLGGLGLFALGGALSGAAPSLAALCALRALQGFGAACALPATVALLIAVRPPGGRSGAIAMWAVGAAVGASVGPSAGGVLMHVVGWRPAFALTAPIALALAALARRGVPARGAASAPGGLPDPVGALLLGAALGGVSLVLVQGPRWGWASATTTLGALAVVATGTAFVVRTRSHPRPVLDLRLLASRRVAAATLGVALFNCSFFAMLLALVHLLVEAWGFGELQAGLAIAPGPLLSAVVGLRSNRFYERWSPAFGGLIGSLMFAAGFASWLVLVGDRPHYLTALLPGYLVVGSGGGLAQGGLQAAALASMPADRLGVGGGVVNTARQCGAVLGVALLVAFADAGTRGGDYASAWALVLALALGASACAAVALRAPSPA